MIAASNGDFFGGYDHRQKAGPWPITTHRTRQETVDLGQSRVRVCVGQEPHRDDGPYIELMAGVYTDNQPDFSFLAPGETKTFSQFWYPIREIGVPEIGES